MTNLRLTDVPLPTSVKSVEDNIQSTNLSYKHQQSPALPILVDQNKLSEELDGYDVDLKQFLVKGFQYSFSIGCDTTPSVPLSKNHSSALNHCEVINSHIQKSLELNRIAGPFLHPPFDPFISSSLGVVPK